MYSMIQNRLRAPVTALITPICRTLLKLGVTPNGVTIAGAAGSVLSSLYFFSRGEFFIGTLVVSLFVLSDLFDGTMARLSKQGTTRWGALIDSTLDRITDAAICAGIMIYSYGNDEMVIALLALFSLVTGGLIPYIRAKAESLGIDCSVGFAERAERLIILLVGTGLYGLELDVALPIALVVVGIAGLVTIAQRLIVVARS